MRHVPHKHVEEEVPVSEGQILTVSKKKLNTYRMPREADVSHPVKWVQVVKLDKEDMEMADLTCAMEDCRTQLQFLTGRISRYMDNMEASVDEHYDYITVYLGGLQKQSTVALMAIWIFIDWYWDEKERMTDEGSWDAMEGVQGMGPKVKQVPEVLGSASGVSGGREAKTGIEGVDIIEDVSGVGMVDAKEDVE